MRWVTGRGVKYLAAVHVSSSYRSFTREWWEFCGGIIHSTSLLLWQITRPNAAQCNTALATTSDKSCPWDKFSPSCTLSHPCGVYKIMFLSCHYLYSGLWAENLLSSPCWCLLLLQETSSRASNEGSLLLLQQIPFTFQPLTATPPHLQEVRSWTPATGKYFPGGT